jgi:anaphase-promoting complex subunit 4
MDGPAVLELLSEKTLHQKIDPRLVAYNPSMDLLALGGTDQQVLIYRLNGQRVHGSSPKDDGLGVGGFCWKPNGMPASQFTTSNNATNRL